MNVLFLITVLMLVFDCFVVLLQVKEVQLEHHRMLLKKWKIQAKTCTCMSSKLF